jgi:hypothetical protein
MQHFSQPEDRMTDQEARDVLKLLEERRQQREQAMSQPSVRDMAQIANVSESEVADALSDIRRMPWSSEVVNPPKSTRVVVVAVALFLLFFLCLIVVLPPRRATARAQAWGVAEPVIAGTPGSAMEAPAPIAPMATSAP